MSGVAFVDILGGALAILAIFAAFMLWAIFPLMPLILMGAVYGLVRYGVPASVRAAVAAERGTVAAVRWLMQPVAVWALHGPEPATARHGDGRGRR